MKKEYYNVTEDFTSPTWEVHDKESMMERGGLSDVSFIPSPNEVRGIILNNVIREHKTMTLSTFKKLWEPFAFKDATQRAVKVLTPIMRQIIPSVNEKIMEYVMAGVMYSESGFLNTVEATSGAYGPFQLMNGTGEGYIKEIAPNEYPQYHSWYGKWLKTAIFNDKGVCVKQTSESKTYQIKMTAVKQKYMTQLFDHHWETLIPQLKAFISKGYKWADDNRNAQFNMVATVIPRLISLPIFLIYGLNEAGAAVTYTLPTGFIHLRADFNKYIATYDPFSRAIAVVIRLGKNKVSLW